MENPTRVVVPSTLVNDLDQSAILRIAVALSIILQLLFLGSRLYIRWPWRALLGKDDACICIATAIGVLQAGLTISAIARGLGTKRIERSPDPAESLLRMIYATDILFALTNFADKCAVVIFLRRLSSARTSFLACNTLLASCTVCFVGSALSLGLQTPLHSPWMGVMQSSRLPRWIAYEALNAMVEIAVVVFPVFLVKDLQMASTAKLTVVGWFTIRLGIIPLGIYRLLTFIATVDDRHRAYHFVFPQVLLQAEMCYGVVAATLPCLRIFFRSASPHFLDGNAFFDPTITNAATAGWSGHKLSNASRSREQEQNIQLRGAKNQTTADAARGDALDKVSMASDSSRREIVVRYTVDLQYE